MLDVEHTEYVFVGLYDSLSEEDEGKGTIELQVALQKETEMAWARNRYGTEHVENKFYTDLNIKTRDKDDLGPPDALQSGTWK